MRTSIFRSLARAARDTRGVAAVEFAILVPVLVLATVCTADFGLAIYARMQVQNAARAGADYATFHASSFDANAITNAIKSATGYTAINASPAPIQFCGCPGTGGVTTVACNSTCANGNAAGTYVTASAATTYNMLLDYPGVPPSINFLSQATVRTK